MTNFASAVWVEWLKSRRSRVPLLIALGFLLAPLAGGLFMIILKDPEAARSMGLISTKARLTAGTADWPAFLGLLAQAVPAAGSMLYAMLTGWVFGREFSDHTVKELIALPTSRTSIVAAKFVVVAIWALAMSLLVLGVGLLIGQLVDIPGWSLQLARVSTLNLLGGCLLSVALLPFVALAASAGRGYMPAFGLAVLTVALAQVALILGWGDWFPWAVPMLFSGAAGPRTEQLGPHSYLAVILTCLAGLAATVIWWQKADQAK